MSSRSRARRQLRLLWAYFLSLFRHWKAIILGAGLGSAQFLYGALGFEWQLPAWLKSVWWVLVAAPAQYLAWRDAWEARATVAEPITPKGIKLTQSMLERELGGGAARGTRTVIRSVLTASQCLRGREFKLYYDGPVLMSHGIIRWADEGPPGDVILYNVTTANDSRSLTLSLTNLNQFSRYQQYQLSGICLEIVTLGATGVILVEEITAVRPRPALMSRIGRAFGRTEGA